LTSTDQLDELGHLSIVWRELADSAQQERCERPEPDRGNGVDHFQTSAGIVAAEPSVDLIAPPPEQLASTDDRSCDQGESEEQDD
jgi:hypothetical protein